MSASQPFPFLTVLVLAPLIAGGAIALIPMRMGPLAHRSEAARRKVVEWLGLGTSLAILGVAATVTARFAPHDSRYQMVSDHPWVPGLGISWQLGVDGISLFLVLLTAVIFPLALLGGRSKSDPKSFVAWMLVLEAACMGSFLSLDLILFFVFFELTLVPAYFLIGRWGYQQRGYASIKFFVYTFAGSAFLLVGFIAIAALHQAQTGVLTFNIVKLTSTRLDTVQRDLIFWAMTAAFAVKAPVFPLHTWSPDAYAEAPVAGSVVLVAVLAKLGTYGIIRFDLTLVPRAVVSMAPVLLTLAVIGIIYGAIVAASQKDLKRMVAYSSLSHIGFIVLGLFALSSLAVTGSVVQMVNHGLLTAALFLLIGMIYERRGTWQMPRLKGLQRSAPVMAAVFLIFVLGSVGLPGLNSFVGEFLILIGTFVTHRWWGVVAVAGVVLSVVYMLWAFQRVFHREADPENSHVADLNWGERLLLVPLVALVLVIGLYPKPVLQRIEPTVDALVTHVETAAHPNLVAKGTVAPGTRPNALAHHLRSSKEAFGPASVHSLASALGQVHFTSSRAGSGASQ